MTTSQRDALKQIAKIYEEAKSDLSYFNARKIADKMDKAEQLIKRYFPEDYAIMIEKRKSLLSLAV